MIRKSFLASAAAAVFLSFSSPPALTQTKAGFNAGLVNPHHLFTTIGAGGLLDFAFDLGSSGSIHLQPTLEFWYSYHDRYYYYWDLYKKNYPWSIFEVSLNPLARYYLPVPGTLAVKPFLGFGLAFDFPTFHYDYINPDPGYHPYYYDNRFLFGYNVLLGIDFRMSRTSRGFVEIRGKMGYIPLTKILFGMMFPIGGSR